MTPELQTEINEAATKAHSLDIKALEKLGLRVLVGDYKVSTHKPGAKLQALLKNPRFVVIGSASGFAGTSVGVPYRPPTLAHDTQGNLYKIEKPPAARSIGICKPCDPTLGIFTALQSKTAVLEVPEDMTWKGIKNLSYPPTRLETHEVQEKDCSSIPGIPTRFQMN